MSESKVTYANFSLPIECQICGSIIKPKGFFVDGATTNGPWAIMCPRCHRRYGCGLGVGKGQKYQLLEDGKTQVKVSVKPN